MDARLHRTPGHSRTRRHRRRGRALDELLATIRGRHPVVRGPQIPSGPVGVDEDLAIAAARTHAGQLLDESRVPRRRSSTILLCEPMRVVAPVLFDVPVHVADQTLGHSGRQDLTSSVSDDGFCLSECIVRFHMGTLS
jgi:hypothetical protein